MPQENKQLWEKSDRLDMVETVVNQVPQSM